MCVSDRIHISPYILNVIKGPIGQFCERILTDEIRNILHENDGQINRREETNGVENPKIGPNVPQTKAPHGFHGPFHVHI